MVRWIRWHWIQNSSLRSKVEHATSRSRKLATVLNLHEYAGKKHCVSLKLESQSGVRARDLRLFKRAIQVIPTCVNNCLQGLCGLLRKRTTSNNGTWDLEKNTKYNLHHNQNFIRASERRWEKNKRKIYEDIFMPHRVDGESANLFITSLITRWG